MPCTKVVFLGGIGIACTRGLREKCGTPGCGGTSVALCDWLLGGAKKGKTCDRKLCPSCRVNVGPNKDYCRPHAEMPKDTSMTPIAIVGARAYQALHLVREVVLALPTVRVVSGHAIGVDIVAEITAVQRDLPTSVYPVRVARGAAKGEFTKAAMARNTLIADEGTEGHAFINPTSRGTWDTVQKMRGLGKVVHIHEEPPPAEHALLFHTAPHPRTRQAPKGYTGPSGFDITRGSGGPAGSPFAPSEGLLNEARRLGQIEAAELGLLRATLEIQKEKGHTALVESTSQVIAEVEQKAFNWYEPRFVEEMRASWRTNRPAWDAVLARNHFVALCYCTGRDACHRGIFARLLVKAGEKVGRRVIDGGEVRCW